VRTDPQNGQNAARTGRLRTAVTWIGTVVLLGLLALTTDLEKAWAAFEQADHLLLPVSIVGFTLATWLVDTATTRVLLGYCGIRVPFNEFARIKGASYLLNVINYNLALVMMAAVVKRRTDRGWGSAGSPFIALNFLDLSGMAVQAFGGFAMAGVLPQLGATGTAILLTIAAGGLLAPPILAVLSRIENAPGFLGRLLRHDLFSAFRALTAGRIAAIVVLRACFISLYVMQTWMNLKAFHIDVPLDDAFVFNPILGLVGFIPISVSGIGTTQFLARGFFGPFVPVDPTLAGEAATRAMHATVDAYSTAAIAGGLLTRAAIGVICMPYVARLRKGGSVEAAEPPGNGATA